MIDQEQYRREWLARNRPSNLPPLPVLPCRHLGPTTGMPAPCDCPTPPILHRCTKHSLCTVDRPALRNGQPVVPWCDDCRRHRRGYEPPTSAVQVDFTPNHIGSIGDAILGLTAAEGLRRQFSNREVVYAIKVPMLEWVKLFGGYDHVTVELVPDLLTYCPVMSGEAELATRPRWEIYAIVCGTTAALPEVRPLPPEAMEWGQRFSGSVALAPWSNHDERTWPLDHWRALERLLIAENFSTIVVDGDENRATLAGFRGEVVAGQVPSRVASLFLHSALVIGNDSGPAHVAGMLGCDTIAMCWTRNGQHIYGFYPRVQVVQSPFAAAIDPKDIAARVIAMTRRREQRLR